jgi:hypothetical protein
MEMFGDRAGGDESPSPPQAASMSSEIAMQHLLNELEIPITPPFVMLPGHMTVVISSTRSFFLRPSDALYIMSTIL